MATEVQELYVELQGHLQRENFQKAIDTSNKIRAKAPADVDAARVKAQCLLRTGKATLEIAAKVDGMELEQAYCHYKLKQVEKALEVLSRIPEPKSKSALHLEAQSHYRLNNFNDSIRIYESLLSNAHASDDTVELKTNLIAAYVAAGRGAELQTRALEVLCQDSLAAEGYSAAEIDQEAAVIRVQEAYVAQLTGREEHALDIYRRVSKSNVDAGLVAVAHNNIATIQQRSSKDTFDSLKRLRSVSKETLRDKCSSSQHETILANLALVLALMHKPDEASAAVDALAQQFPHSAFLPPLQLHLSASDDDGVVSGLADSLKGTTTASGLLTLAHLHCRLGRPAKAGDALRQIPAIQHTPGTVATLVALYDAALDAKTAAAVVDEAVRQSAKSAEVLLEGVGLAKLSQGAYAAAAAAFCRLLDGGGHDVEAHTRVRVLAYAVVALSYVDPTAAAARAATLPSVQSSDVSVDELVRRAPKPRGATVVVVPALAKEKKKKGENRERVLRKRAKRKAQFIASLKAKADYNPLIGLVNPDPERWIPRKQRSRRGRKNRKFVGAQGAGMGTAKDAAKLDAAARAAAKKAAPAVDKGVLVTDGPSSMNRKARKRR
ncbi:hypothetical protein DYB30_006607 [Aphanomyces astaci]|uniref:Signal recognition particle subunit SRP72 n=1 Tax=Aphanomyces astaci TaxID=112090 RepID=A0A397DW59_APHAT|nr:hypothetical protein DYB34_001087 [Aphanomyces astaci]RHY69357.1 hypothetical protein DYB30_006607 [Aphanomyces astaci]RHZ19035.1 hypothetical protein DYB26_002136 [Aphanomyces astaci]